MSQSGGFCAQCGTPLASKYSPCPNCGHTKTTYNPQPAGGASGHCGQCGAALASKYAPCPKCGYIKTKYEPGKSRSTRPVIIATIVFVGLISTIIGVDLYATQSLEMQSKGVTNSDFSTLTIHFELSIYNPTVIPTSFDVIYADILYKSRTLGTATIYGEPLPPSSYTDVSGKFEIDPVNVMALAFGGMAGGGMPDKNDIIVNVKLEKRILGFIPFMYEKNYNIDEFTEAFGP
jgi:hypothetical protein